MARLLVLLYFFIHLAIMLKAPRFKWLSRVIGYGLSGLFLFLVISGAEPNSNIVFIVSSILAALGVFAAEIIASIVKKDKNTA